MRLCTIVGILWIFAFPHIAQDVFTSENALRGEFLSSTLKDSPKLLSTYDSIKKEMEPLNTLLDIKDFIKKHLSSRMETYMQPLATV